MKNVFSILFITFCLGNVFTQEIKKTVNYSESDSYQPREFKDKKNRAIDAYGKPIKKNSSKSDKSNSQSIPRAISKTLELPVFIENKDGKPILDLNKEDFQLFINGEEKEFRSLEKKDIANNIIILLDLSGSTDASRLKATRSFATQLVQKFSSQYKIKLISFDERVKVHSNFTNDSEQLLYIIKKLGYGGGTSFYDAIAFTLEKELESPTTIFLITDAVDTTSTRFTYENSLLLAEKREATFFTFYVNSSEFIDTDQSLSGFPFAIGPPFWDGKSESLKETYERGSNYLLDLTMISGGKLFLLKNKSQITDNDLNSVSQKIKPQYYLKFDLETIPKPFERIQIKVRVKGQNLYVRTRGSYIIN